MLSVGVAPCAQDAHGLVPGPECPASGRVPVVQGELRFVQGGLDPAEEVVAVTHAAARSWSSTFAPRDNTAAPRRLSATDERSRLLRHRAHARFPTLPTLSPPLRPHPVAAP